MRGCKVITSLPEFVNITQNFDLVSRTIIFRGQAVKGQLVPSIARRDVGLDTKDKEKEVMDQLRLLGASLLPDHPPANSLDLLVRAQHYGLKTRLLDWTSNPLAALWFAVTDEQPGDAYVYVLEADDVLLRDPYKNDPLKISHTHVFQPRFTNDRVIAQQGWFTLHRYSSTSKKFVPLEGNSETKDRLTEIRIPAADRSHIEPVLDRFGINRATLFPGLEGLCRHLNWKHELAPAKPVECSPDESSGNL